MDGIIKIVFIFITIVSLIMPVPAPVRAGGGNCNEKISSARYEYLAFKFHRIPELLESCLEEGNLERHQRHQIYELLSLAYLELGALEESRVYLRLLLGEEPGYPLNPDPERQDYIQLIDEVTAELQHKKPNLRWLAVGAGVLAGTFATILTLKHNEESSAPRFPQPPGRPAGD